MGFCRQEMRVLEFSSSFFGSLSGGLRCSHLRMIHVDRVVAILEIAVKLEKRFLFDKSERFVSVRMINGLRIDIT